MRKVKVYLIALGICFYLIIVFLNVLVVKFDFNITRILDKWNIVYFCDVNRTKVVDTRRGTLKNIGFEIFY